MFKHPFAPEAIESDPRLRYIPVMIARLMLSLKKAGDSQEHGWSLVVSTTHNSIRFAERRGGVVTRDETPLDNFRACRKGLKAGGDALLRESPGP